MENFTEIRNSKEKEDTRKAWVTAWAMCSVVTKGIKCIQQGSTNQQPECRPHPVYPSAAPMAAAAKSLQSCPTLCDPIDGSPPGSPVPGILQARTLEWVASSFSSAWKWKVKVKLLSCVRLLATRWTAAHQAPSSLGFSRQEHWSGLPVPSPVHESEKWKWSRSVVSDS